MAPATRAILHPVYRIDDCTQLTRDTSTRLDPCWEFERVRSTAALHARPEPPAKHVGPPWGCACVASTGTHLEAAETDEHDVAHCNADLSPHLATDVAHALHTVEAVGLEPGTSVHLEHLRVLLALVLVFKVQLALAIAIALCARPVLASLSCNARSSGDRFRAPAQTTGPAHRAQERRFHRRCAHGRVSDAHPARSLNAPLFLGIAAPSSSALCSRS